MKETVLLYGFKDQERLKKVKRALLPLGEEQEIRQAVDWIVANKRNVGEPE